MSIEKLLRCRFSISLQCGFDVVALQDIGDGRVRQDMAEIGYCALDAPITPHAIFLSHTTTSSEISARVFGRPGVRHVLPSYFLAINLRCQANGVCSVTIVATCAKTFRLSF